MGATSPRRRWRRWRRGRASCICRGKSPCRARRASTNGWRPRARTAVPRGRGSGRYRVRRGQQIYRTGQCRGCGQAESCGVRGRSKEVHVPLPETARGQLAQRMSSAAGQEVYAQRQRIVEPVFGRFKHNWGARRLLLRGRSGAQVELSLLCLAHNLSKWIQAGGPGLAAGRGGLGPAGVARIFRWPKLFTRPGSGVARARV